jgi:hypothetical protein
MRYLATRVRFPLLLALVIGGLAWGQQTAAPASASTDTVTLYATCNNPALTWNAGTPLSMVAAGISPASALESIWRYDTARDRFVGWSPIAGAPNDYTTLGARAEAAWVCMRAMGQLDRPTI